MSFPMGKKSKRNRLPKQYNPQLVLTNFNSATHNIELYLSHVNDRLKHSDIMGANLLLVASWKEGWGYVKELKETLSAPEKLVKLTEEEKKVITTNYNVLIDKFLILTILYGTTVL